MEVEWTTTKRGTTRAPKLLLGMNGLSGWFFLNQNAAVERTAGALPMKHTDRIDGNIGQDLTYCEVCGLEADECKCDAALVDEELEGEEE